jgi:CBS domain containing-hemolysin-like protein
MTTDVVYLAVALVLVAFCGLFVAAEFALVTVERAEVDRAAAAGDRRAQGVQQALQTLSTQLSGAQLGITITNLAIGFLAEPAISRLVDGPLLAAGVPEGAVRPISVTLGLAAATAMTMIFGELVPKNLALARPSQVAAGTQGFQRGFTTAMAWPIRVLNGAANALLRLVGVDPQEELRSARSARELGFLVHHSAEEGVLEQRTAGLLERSLAFGGRTAGDVMTPRMRVVFVDGDAPVAAALDLARASGHSRFPVSGAGRDDVIGILHVKQAVGVPPAERGGRTVAEVASPPVAVPETLPLDPLLALLRRHGMQMAVVVDEYGGTHGVVTLEDLVEEIVGDIADEHDTPDPPVRELPGGWSLSGLLRPDEVQALTGVALPEGEDYETVAGLVLQRLGRLPGPGDRVRVGPAVLTVERLDGRRIDRLRLEAEVGAVIDPEAGLRRPDE